MRLIDADKLYPDCMTKDGKLAISQSQLANAPTIKSYTLEDLEKANNNGYKWGKKDAKAMERPQGEWINNGTTAMNNFCSICKECVLSTHYNFCPNCGAKMKGGAEE